MERIQEAIEKARKQRQGSIGATNAGSSVRQPGDDAARAESVVHSSSESETDTMSEAASRRESPAASGKQQPTSTEQGDGRSLGAHGQSSIRIKYSQTKTIARDEQALKERFIVAGFSHEKRAEPYRQLRSQILQIFRDNNFQTLAITSPSDNSGATLTAINLAVSLSLEANQTVLLVDLNLRAPGVASTFGFDEVDYGIVDCINGTSPLENVLLNPGFERLVVLPGTPQPSFTSEILSSPEMRALKQELEQRYPSRMIIFDLPSMLDNDDALVFAPLCDATLMVVEEGGTKKQDLERAYELLGSANIIGSVLNKVRYM